MKKQRKKLTRNQRKAAGMEKPSGNSHYAKRVKARVRLAKRLGCEFAPMPVLLSPYFMEVKVDRLQEVNMTIRKRGFAWSDQ